MTHRTEHQGAAIAPAEVLQAAKEAAVGASHFTGHLLQNYCAEFPESADALFTARDTAFVRVSGLLSGAPVVEVFIVVGGESLRLGHVVLTTPTPPGAVIN